jgi:hypothetical protein
LAQTHLPAYWDIHVLGVLGANHHQSLRFIQAQARCEGGTAKWNPLNSTLDLGPPWTEPEDYNSTGVKNYRYPIAGVCATALTWIQRKADGTLLYAPLIGDLQKGEKTAEQMVEDNRAVVELWGTSPDLMLQVLKEIP